MHEQEIEWQSYVGVTYDLQATTDFINWSTVVTVQGNGAKQSHVEQTSGPRRFFRLRQSFKEGTEPLFLQAVTAWDGSYVQLEWNSLGSPATPTAHFKILKNGTQLTTAPHSATSYRDTVVSSGQRYTYSVGYYN